MKKKRHTVEQIINDPVASRARPVRELKGFTKVLLKQGERKTVSFRIGPDDLALWTINCRMEPEPGEFKFWLGDLQGEFAIKREM
ncbi:MAG: fibronectin type III-like domain-contianing protein [Opitutales bacterium]|jgi:beta-glucosidase